VISFYLCIEQKKKKKKVFAILIYEMVCVNCKERLRESGDCGKIGIGKQRW
jgi:hypothetical protein